MLILITYDVKTETPAGRRRLSRVAKICCDFGQRVQNSVFECDLDASQYVLVKNKLKKEIMPEEDSLCFYQLGNKYSHKIERFGCKSVYDPEDVLIF